MKIISSLFFLVLIGQVVYSQKTTSEFSNPLLGNQIWLKQNNESSVTSYKSRSTPVYQLNFNNPVIFEGDQVVARFSSVWNNRSTFFVVLQSDDEQEVPFLKVLDKNNSIRFTNKGTYNADFKPYEKGNPQQGIILTHQSSLAKVTANNLIQFNKDLLSGEQAKTKIMEFIYIPEVVSKERQQIIESYLSIKYGISLNKEKDYFNLKGDKIWNAKENEIFNYRVTGIGKESELSLNQKRSANAEKDGLLIGVEDLKNQNISEKNVIPNQAYVMWGDNNQKTILHKRNGLQSYQKMDRVWKMQTSGVAVKDSVKLSFFIDAQKMKLSDKKNSQFHNQEEYIWLVINDKSTTDNFDYQTATYYKQKAIQDSIVFEGISVKENQTFTFVKAPDLFATYQAQTNSCLSSINNKIEAKIINGQAPFYIKITGQKTDKSFSVSTSQFQIPNLIFGTYTIQITDAQKRSYTSNITLEPFSNLEVDIPAQWQLHSNEPVVIQPNIKGKDAETLKYTWTCENKVISNENQISTQIPGNYKLKLTTAKGCEKEMSFRVTNSSDGNLGQWAIFPNPVKQGQFYTIRFNLEQESEVSILLFGINGQLLANKKLGKIDVAEIKEHMHLALGEYVLQVSINGVTTTKKIIVE